MLQIVKFFILLEAISLIQEIAFNKFELAMPALMNLYNLYI